MVGKPSSYGEDLTICLLIGCYPGEDYCEDRISWLQSVIDDISSQTYRQSHLLVSINSNISPYSEKKIYEALAQLDDYSIFKTHYPRNGMLNFEMLLAATQTEYVSFWSDHDRHSSSFCETLISYLKSNPELGLVAAHDVCSNLEKMINCEFRGAGVLRTSALSINSKAKLAMTIPIGSLYGVWRRTWLTKVLCSDPVEYPDLLSDVLCIQHGKLDIVFLRDIFHLRNRRRTQSTVNRNAQSLLGMRDLEKDITAISIRTIRQACDCINLADKASIVSRRKRAPSLAQMITFEIVNGRSTYISRSCLWKEFGISVFGAVPVIGYHYISSLGASLSYSLRLQYAFEATKGVAVLIVNYLCALFWLLRSCSE